MEKRCLCKSIKKIQAHYKITGHSALSEKQLVKIASYISEQGDETGFATLESRITHKYPYSIAQKIYEHIGYEEYAKKLESKKRNKENLHLKVLKECK